MNIYLSVAFTLLAVVAGMYLLAKTKAESLGKFFKFVSYLVIVISGLSLVCLLGRGACMMVCNTSMCPPSENCMPGMMIHKEIRMHGMSGECRMHGACSEDEECCESRGHGDGMGGSCEMKGGHGHGDCCMGGGEGKGGCMHEEGEESEMKSDSTRAKK